MHPEETELVKAARTSCCERALLQSLHRTRHECRCRKHPKLGSNASYGPNANLAAKRSAISQHDSIHSVRIPAELALIGIGWAPRRLVGCAYDLGEEEMFRDATHAVNADPY